MTTEPTRPKTILEEAKELVYGDREKAYGHPIIDFTATAHIWTGLLLNKLDTGKAISAKDVALCMAGLKLSRESRNPRRDNRVDAIGYVITADRVERALDDQRTKGLSKTD